MKKIFLSAVLLVTLFVFSCKEDKPYDEPVVQPAAVLKDVISFLNYRQQHLRLADDFKAIDTTSAEVDKATFFQQLSTGNFLPLRLKSKNTTAYYQLYSLASQNKDEVQSILKDWGTHLKLLYEMEGKELPAYQFTDMDGKMFSEENTKGKILVVKCWFIGCKPCVEEMPALNQLVKQYSSRQDIAFIGLALDKKEALKPFLKRFQFDYAVIPEQESYIMEQLQVNQFPTHLLINKQGRIAKVVNNHQELTTALKKLAL
jgi:peroxiredoxin